MEYVEHDKNGQPVTYVHMLKALCEMVQSASLFHRKSRKDLERHGFEIDPCDPCVANRMIESKDGKEYQIAVLWHVDDFKISSEVKRIVDDFIQWLKDTHEDDAGEVKTSRGRELDFLAMNLIHMDGKVIIEMKKCVEKMVKEFKDETGLVFKYKPNTPAKDHLFKVGKDRLSLEEKRKDPFHTTTARAPFLCEPARPDILTVVAFLCTRALKPDTDDWGKPVRMIGHLELTLELLLTLEPSEFLMSSWFVDGAFAVHNDMKSHTGGVSMMGKGAVNSVSAKQKINTKSGTEAELIAADDCSGLIVWTKCFLEAQGYKLEDNILCQDNRSAISSEENGKESSGKRTRHIDTRCFFLTDRIKMKEPRVAHAGTEDVIADCFTKPLQGKQFKKMRKLTMNEPQNVSKNRK